MNHKQIKCHALSKKHRPTTAPELDYAYIAVSIQNGWTTRTSNQFVAD